jgi:hypothetical protein
MGLLPRMAARLGARLRRVALALASVALLVAAHPAAADSHHGGWHGGGRGGGFHGGFHGPFHHFHSFVFFGAGLGYPYYYPAYGYPAYPPPPPVYVSPTECYQPPVPRAPGVADLYTCGGQYVGPIAVP